MIQKRESNPRFERSAGRMLRVLPILALFLAIVPSSRAQDEPVSAQLVSESLVAIPGQTLSLGLLLDIDPGWHVYWPGQNDVGFPVHLTLSEPQGAKAQPLLWPGPTRYVSKEGLLDHVYFDRVLLIVPVKVPESAVPGTTLQFEGEAEWLVCNEAACVPGFQEVGFEIRVEAAQLETALSTHAQLFASTRTLLPRPLPTDSSIKVSWDAPTLTIEANGTTSLTFHAYEKSLVPDDLKASGTTTGSRLRFDLHEPLISDEGNKPGVKGVLEVIRPKQDTPVYYEISIPASSSEWNSAR